MGAETTWTLDELSRLSGYSKRTIRYYISRGVLPGPLRAGRGSRYGEAHLERLARIRELQERGLTLAEIAFELAGEGGGDLPEPVPCQVFALAPGVMVQVRADLPPWRLKKIRRGLEAFARHLATDETVMEIRDGVPEQERS